MSFRNLVMILLAMLVSLPVYAQTIKRLLGDENKDGALSKTEYLAGYEKRFEDMDANKDGSVTWNEKAAYDEARKIAKEKKDAVRAEKKAASDDKKTFLNRFFD